MERAANGYHLRDAATGEPVRWEDPRIRVVPVAGISYRAEAAADPSFDPGRRLALVPEPGNEHDPHAVGIWNAERTLQAGYVPATLAPELRGDEQAVSLWRYDGDEQSRGTLPVPPDPLGSTSQTGRSAAGLRVLVVSADAWVGLPRS
jgi:hypothetical protein